MAVTIVRPATTNNAFQWEKDADETKIPFSLVSAYFLPELSTTTQEDRVDKEGIWNS